MWNDKHCLHGMMVVGEGVWQIQNKDQMCHLVRIGDSNDSTVFHISKRIFKVTLSPIFPFKCERCSTAVAPAIHDPIINELHASGRNVVHSLGSCILLAKNIV